MTLLYEPNTGMPYEIPPSEIANFIRKGYRFTPPLVAETPVLSVTGNNEQPAIALPASENQRGVKVNSATLKELAALPLVGTAIAKQMRDSRPYSNVEDLIAKIPEVDWLSINAQLSYELEADAAS